nr:MAG TPA: tail collar domain [Caudoviricetes sp.]
MSVSDWSATADENTTVDGINIAEHCPAKNINNAIRSVMAAVKAKCDTLDATDNLLRRGAVIGEVRWFAMSTPPTGWLVCNGAAVGTSDYAELFAVIGKTFTPRLTSTDPDVENPEYSDLTIFRLPNLMGKVPWGTSSQVGTEMEAGLPNITGFLGDSYGPSGSFYAVSGAFRERYSGKRFSRTEDNNPSKMDVDFNASWSNPIYGKSSTVQPPALCLLPCIRYE